MVRARSGRKSRKAQRSDRFYAEWAEHKAAEEEENRSLEDEENDAELDAIANDDREGVAIQVIA